MSRKRWAWSGPGHPGQSRHQGERDGRGAEGDRQEEEVHRQLEPDNAACHPVGDEQQRRELYGLQSRLDRGRARAPDDLTDLRVAPPGARHQGDTDPPRPPPLRTRVQQDRAGRARSEQQHERGRDLLLARRPCIHDRRHAENGDRAEILQRRRRGGQREAPVSIHDRRGRADDGVEHDLRQEQQDQDGADVLLAPGRGGVRCSDRAEPQQQGGPEHCQRNERHHAEHRDAEQPPGGSRGCARVPGVDVRHQHRDENRREKRPAKQAVEDEVGQRVRELIGVGEVCRAEHSCDHDAPQDSGEPADDRPYGHGDRVAHSALRRGQIQFRFLGSVPVSGDRHLLVGLVIVADARRWQLQ